MTDFVIKPVPFGTDGMPFSVSDEFGDPREVLKE